MDLWHQRLGHASHKQIEKISKCEAVLGLPKFEKTEKSVCGPCQIGKQVKARHPSISEVQTSRPLELLNIDLMGPTKVQSLGGMKYIPVVGKIRPRLIELTSFKPKLLIRFIMNKNF